MTAPAHDDRRPRDPSTGEPLAPRPQPGYYPGFHTLDQRAFWDEATRKVILARLQPAPPPVKRNGNHENHAVFTVMGICSFALPLLGYYLFHAYQ